MVYIRVAMIYMYLPISLGTAHLVFIAVCIKTARQLIRANNICKASACGHIAVDSRVAEDHYILASSPIMQTNLSSTMVKENQFVIAVLSLPWLES